VTALLMLVMTVMLGVPAGIVLTVRQSRGGVLAAAGWFGGVYAGVLPGDGGPLGVGSTVFWVVAGVFGVMFLRNFVLVSVSAWRAGWRSWRMQQLGAPPREML
jgi:hypothetical protein